jgi:hypothetical protein
MTDIIDPHDYDAESRRICRNVPTIDAIASALRAAERRGSERCEIRAAACCVANEREVERLRIELAATKRALDRWQTGTQIEGDYVRESDITTNKATK